MNTGEARGDLVGDGFLGDLRVGQRERKPASFVGDVLRVAIVKSQNWPERFLGQVPKGTYGRSKKIRAFDSLNREHSLRERRARPITRKLDC